jgi:hypothetical protein
MLVDTEHKNLAAMLIDGELRVILIPILDESRGFEFYGAQAINGLELHVPGGPSPTPSP